jgi:hypothetical protein
VEAELLSINTVKALVIVVVLVLACAGSLYALARYMGDK